jgi:hypothetical protein
MKFSIGDFVWSPIIIHNNWIILFHSKIYMQKVRKNIFRNRNLNTMLRIKLPLFLFINIFVFLKILNIAARTTETI